MKEIEKIKAQFEARKAQHLEMQKNQPELISSEWSAKSTASLIDLLYLTVEEILSLQSSKGISDEIVEEAKKRYPYNENETPNRINKLSSKRRRFIEGGHFVYDLLRSKLSEGETVQCECGRIEPIENARFDKEGLHSCDKCYIDMLTEKLSEGSKTNGWVDVKDRLPKTNEEFGEGEYVLCETKNEQFVGWYNSKKAHLVVAHSLAKNTPLTNIQHWMRLVK